jgi:hypothetical protein
MPFKNKAQKHSPATGGRARSGAVTKPSAEVEQLRAMHASFGNQFVGQLMNGQAHKELGDVEASAHMMNSFTKTMGQTQDDMSSRLEEQGELSRSLYGMASELQEDTPAHRITGA